MPFQLRDDLHWCDCAGRVVFLDTIADRYFCLSQAANEAFLRAAAQNIGSLDFDPLHMLLERGLLLEANGDSTIRPPPAIEAPTRDLLQNARSRARPLPILETLVAELRAARDLRSRPFCRVIDRARRQPLAQAPATLDPAQAIERIAAASAAVSFITRSHDRCLVRALAVQAMCVRRGLRTKLVFGVVAHPFTAHCWVQFKEAVVIGGYEQARLYTPILVLQ
jgi:hypothetical protein